MSGSNGINGGRFRLEGSGSSGVGGHYNLDGSPVNIGGHYSAEGSGNPGPMEDI